ncbi:copper chaperone PCu(A)C [Glaciecola sp. SC05]|uniref:copper chaperone PCu(A)C n=1 Tax=Glaciecola sp. SC05 TaxID=1987355 RepID=UPI003528CF00
MKHTLLISFFLLFSSYSLAHNHAEKSMAENIVIEAAWARETFKMAKTGAAYITLSNPTENDITLVSASADESVAGMVEMHNTVVVDNMMRMQELEDGLIIKAGETITFQPGGMHFMIMGLTGPLLGNSSFELELAFADDSVKSTTVNVRDMRTAVE